MIRLDVAYILLASSIGLFTFETMIMVRNGFLNGKVRGERLGDYEKPVLLAWFSGFLLVPQVTCDILGYVFCDIYSVNIAFLTSAVTFTPWRALTLHSSSPLSSLPPAPTGRTPQ